MSAWSEGRDRIDRPRWTRMIGPFEVHVGPAGAGRWYASALGFVVSSIYKSPCAAMRGAERHIERGCRKALADLAMLKEAPAPQLEQPEVKPSEPKS